MNLSQMNPPNSSSTVDIEADLDKRGVVLDATIWSID